MNSKTEDRLLGAFFGGLCGDSLGAPLEFGPRLPRETKVEMTGGGSFGWEPGAATDDSDLALCVTRMYLNCGGYNQKALVRNFLDWESTRPKDIGCWTRRSFHEWHKAQFELDHVEQLRGDSHPIVNIWRKAGSRDAGNGSVMRCWPTILSTPDKKVRLSESKKISEDSHPDPRCNVSCQAVVEAASVLARGGSTEEAFDEAKEVAKPNKEVYDAVNSATTLPWERWTNSGFVIGTVQSAFAGLAQAKDFESGLRSVVAVGNDADSCGATAGPLLGAKFGLSAIPTRWLNKLHGKTPSGKYIGFDDYLQMAKGLLSLRQSRRRVR
jgi:ADP-ribosyl-[dinitrogen reductase] hydrolase